ncbi:MAG: DUF3108 domain-containing protein [Alphaproteobacteria bacterium]|nr:DUF3108 domain-containing protein [Alphaproteobacteria bacterium]MBV9062435.1 DUF3108 domain-containing protein [Alphaproteobacteria bacterium]
MSISLLLAAAVALASASAPDYPQGQSAGAHSISLSYTLRLIGIPFGNLEYSAQFGASRYRAQMHFRTYGLAAVLWKSQIDAAAQGRMTLDALLPSSYTTRSVSRSGAHRVVRLDYSGKAVPAMTADPSYDLSAYALSDAQKQGTVDPLTAITAVVGGFSEAARPPCTATLPVFDGRRRYDIAFSFVRNEPQHGGMGEHPRLCKAEYRHIAGLKQDVVDVSQVPSIYVALDDVPVGARHYTVARAIWSSFLWGAVTARLTEAKLDGAVLPQIAR